MSFESTDDGSDDGGGLVVDHDPDRDRRMYARLPARERRDIVAVRVRPGITAALVDLSRSGAALDAERRLIPGRFVHLQFVFLHGGLTMRAKVVRTEVAQLSAGRVVYRCAVQFDRFLENGSGD